MLRTRARAQTRPAPSPGAAPGLRARVDRLVDAAKRHRHLVAFAVFVLVIGGIYLSVLVGDRSLLTNGALPSGPLFVGDPTAGGAITVPFERLEAMAWSHLRYPVIDPYQGYGIPLLADQGVPVYPLEILANLIFPHNYSVWIVVNLMALAFGSYLLASSFGQRFVAAMAVGTAAALAGVAPPNLNLGMVNPLALLPFVLLSIRYAVDPASRHRRTALLGTATSVALMCLSGFQEVLPLFAAVILIYTLALALHYRTWRVRPGLILSTAVSGLVGIVVGLVGLLPDLAIVRGHSSLNTPGSYILHEPLYWLATLMVPRVAGPSLAGQPQDLTQTVWTLGSPVLVAVVVLAFFLVVRRKGGGLGWYVWPSIALVVYGVLGYANLLHVLVLFDVPVLDSILTIRFLQFAWWIPWCLLLGAVISEVRRLRWYDAVVALAVTGLLDLLLVVKYRNALTAHKLSSSLHVTKEATLKAAVVVAVFLVLVVVARWAGPVVMAALAVLVAGTCIYYLPTNFFPASAGTTASALRVPGGGSGDDHLAYLNSVGGTVVLPTTTFSMQIFGPIVPWAYQATALTLFTSSEDSGLSPLFDGLPTFALAVAQPRMVSVLQSLGVDTLVTVARLSTSTFGPIASCQAHSPRSDVGATTAPGLCYLGQASYVGGPKAPPMFAYAISGASPLVEATAAPQAVASDQVGLDDFLGQLSPSVTTLPTDAYVTSPPRRLVAARDVSATGRRASTQQVSMSVATTSAGLVVLRETYLSGMRASVNGASVPVMAVDGGLWTAVPVGSGRSHVVLDYVSLSDQVEFGVAFVGLLALAVAWVTLGASAVRRRAGP